MRADGLRVSRPARAAGHRQLPEGVDLVLLDYKLPDMDGVTVLRADQGVRPRRPGHSADRLCQRRNRGRGDEERRVSLRQQAVRPRRRVFLVAQALETTQLRREVRQPAGSQGAALQRRSHCRPVDAMDAGASAAAKVATSPASTVLLTGESGTGKDLAAKVLHFNSDRAHKPFMNITCSALPETLLESELFGHERGAFTDARQQKRGLFESADGGTVFLDEIGEMVPALQAKLLRVLEEKRSSASAGQQDITVDVRVDRGNQSQSRRGSQGRAFSAGPVLPPQRAADRAAAAARASRRRPGAGGVLHRPVQSRIPQERARRLAGGAEGAAALRLARQHSRAAQRHRAGDAAQRQPTGSSPRTSRR